MKFDTLESYFKLFLCMLKCWIKFAIVDFLNEKRKRHYNTIFTL